MIKNIVEDIISTLGLEPHPEGGYFKEIYRSKDSINKECLEKKYSGNRNYATSIYYLLTSETFSAFHRIHQDEIWHFYNGSPIILHIINERGEYSKVEIGNDIQKGQRPQYVVEGGCWFGATVKDPKSFSLVGCTVSPGFDFSDFELGDCHELSSLFPQHKGIFKRLT